MSSNDIVINTTIETSVPENNTCILNCDEKNEISILDEISLCNDDKLNANSDEIVSLSQNIVKSCSKCFRSTTKKDRSLECGKCKGLVHYECSKLPPYTVYSLKPSKRLYVCEQCADTPKEFMSQWPTIENNVKGNNTEIANVVSDDIQLSIKSICDSVEKVNFAEFTIDLKDKNNNIVSVVSNLQERFSKLEKMIMEKFESWKPDNKPNPCVPSDPMIEHLKKQLGAQENELSLLNEELTAKCKSIEKLASVNKSLTGDVHGKTLINTDLSY